MKHILIIGAKGFIGMHLSAFFRKRNAVVHTCDVVESREENYHCLSPGSPNFEEIFSKQKFDVCINASGSGSVAFANEHPGTDHVLNVLNVQRILEAIKTHDPQCRLVQFSSAAVYGNPEKLPIAESDPIRPVSTYGKHKYESELLCRDYFNEWAIASCCLRVFSVYGPGLRKQLFWDLFRQAREKEVITLGGTGRESRDFIFIDDLVRAVEQVILSAKFNSAPINVASGTETSIRDAATCFLERSGPGKKVNFSGVLRKGDPLNWRADIGLIRSLGFRPEVSLGDGLEKYLQWLRNL